MCSGHATRGEILTAFNKTHQKVLVKVEQLDRALTNFQFEGKSSQGRNLKRIRSVLKFFQEELIDHIELEEQIVFPLLESHIPKLELVIQVLRSEHEDLRRNLGDLQLFLNVLSDGKSQTTHSKIVHKILETGLMAVHFMRPGACEYPSWPGADGSANRPDTLKQTASGHRYEKRLPTGGGPYITPAQPDKPAASVRDFLSGAYTLSGFTQDTRRRA